MAITRSRFSFMGSFVMIATCMCCIVLSHVCTLLYGSFAEERDYNSMSLPRGSAWETDARRRGQRSHGGSLPRGADRLSLEALQGKIWLPALVGGHHAQYRGQLFHCLHQVPPTPYLCVRECSGDPRCHTHDT